MLPFGITVAFLYITYSPSGQEFNYFYNSPAISVLALLLKEKHLSPMGF